MRRLVVCLALAAGASMAEDFSAMTGGEIADVLTDARLSYPGGNWQDFRASGRTLYHAGADSWGYWAVRGDQYCSMWPPSDLWSCYDMARSGEIIRFTGEAGDITDGTLAEGDG